MNTVDFRGRRSHVRGVMEKGESGTGVHSRLSSPLVWLVMVTDCDEGPE